jgi:hypothetical protein
MVRVERARARIRRHVWGIFPAVPVSRVAGVDLGEVIVLDADATLITAHSEKQQAAGTFKGVHPGVWCYNTREMLAVTLRPSNAGSNHAGDHIDVRTRAIRRAELLEMGHRALSGTRLIHGCKGSECMSLCRDPVASDRSLGAV